MITMLSKGKKRLSFDVFQSEDQEVNSPDHENMPKVKRSVKLNYTERNSSHSGWSTIGEGFEGISQDKPECEEYMITAESPAKSQQSIQWHSSDDKESQQDCWKSSPGGHSGLAKNISCIQHKNIVATRNSTGKKTSSLKKELSSHKTRKNYSVKTIQPLKETKVQHADVGAHLLNIDTISSPSSKEEGSIRATQQRLKLVTSSGSEESVYVEGQQEQASECTISQYHSDSEEAVSNIPVTCTSLQGDNEESDSPVSNDGDIADVISSSISQHSSKEDVEEISKVKASDWARSVLHILDNEADTPDVAVKRQTRQLAETSTSCKDIAKARESLTSRIHRLVEREKLYYTTWSQKPNTKSDTDEQKILLVKVNKKEVKYSLLECHCSCLSEQSVLFDSGEDQHEVKLKVLFHMELDKVIKHGSVVKIQPPWQKMSATKAGVLVLCTHYPEVIGYETPDEYKTLREEDVTWVEVARWECPCQKDTSLDSRTCPAHIHPHTLGQVKPDSSEESWNVDGLSNKLDDRNCTTAKEFVVHSTILNGIENQSGFGISFTALIQRTFCRVLSGNRFSRSSMTPDKVQYGFLVQDHKGTLCEIQLPDACLDTAEWKDVITKGEGQVYHFTNLRVVQRANQAKHRGLFTMLNFLWSEELICGDSSSQIKDASPDSEQAANSGPPSFCYILKYEKGDSHCTRSPIHIDLVYHRVFLTEEIPAVEQTVDQRCSILGKVLIQWEKPIKDGSEMSVVYIVNINGLIVPVVVQASFYTLVNELISSNTIIFKDALMSSGKVSVDGYSRVISSTVAIQQEIVTEQQIMELQHVCSTLPQISLKSRLYDLVNVEGEIVGVDESTACSWLACNMCNNDRLAGGTATNPDFHCNRCNKTAEYPIRKLSLEVYLKLKEQGGGKIKVKLTQDSIEKLLPSDMTAEGYDVDCVLNQNLGPLAVVITRSEKTWEHTKLPKYCTQEVKL